MLTNQDCPATLVFARIVYDYTIDNRIRYPARSRAATNARIPRVRTVSPTEVQYRLTMDSMTREQDRIGGRLLSRSTLEARYRSKVDVVGQLLREAILSGEMKPGQRIVVDALASELGISKIPIREALRHLVSEGLAEIIPHVGARVAEPPTVQTLLDTYAVRATLEEMATTLAAKRITPEEIGRLRETAHEIESTEDLDRTTWTRLNIEFHSVVFSASGNLVLAELCKELLNRSAHYRASAGVIHRQFGQLTREHTLLLDAFERRDPVRAGLIARQHVQNSLERVLPFLEKTSLAGTPSTE